MAVRVPNRTLNFNDKTTRTRDIQICNNTAPKSSHAAAGMIDANRPTTDATGAGALSPPNRNPLQGQSCIVMAT
jgi:hypothetical protein